MSDERENTAKAAAPPATAAAGAVAGAAAGLATITLGPIGAAIGAIIGGVAGGAMGATASASDGAHWGPNDDEHYRALWETGPRVAGATYDRAQPAYQFGHIAAQLPEYAGLDFHAAEPSLQREWESDMRARDGEWSAARSYVCDAYGHARADGYGVRRDTSVIGTGGSAVDPVELERARSGLASRADTPDGDDVVYPADLRSTTGHGDEVAEGDEVGDARGERLGERAPIDANSAHNERVELR